MMKRFLIPLLLLIFWSSLPAQELARVRQNNLWGYIDRSGNQVIRPQYEKCGDFSDGMAAVLEGGLWGYIDGTGNWVIRPKYKRVKAFNSGYAMVLDGENWIYIDKKDTPLSVPPADKHYDFQDSIALYKVGANVGFLDTDGKPVIQPTYVEIKDFQYGHARFRQNERWGMLDKQGNVVIDPEYEKLSNYDPNGMVATKNGSNGIIIDGTFIPVVGADKVWEFHSGSDLTYAKRGDNCGFINTSGEWVIQPQWKKVRAFNKGLAPVYDGNLWGYIDTHGKLVIPFIYPDAEVFGDNGLAPVKAQKLWGFINTSGIMELNAMYNISVGPTFNFTSMLASKGFNDGVARVRKGKEWGYINEKGEPIGGQWYQNTEVFSK